MKLHNTLTRETEDFTPQNPRNVTLYTCGPTVYHFLHVGNWIAYIRWDTLVRTLRLSDFGVTRVMNITDVGHLVSDADEGEDKMEKGARREGKSAWDIAALYTEDFMAGMEKLHLVVPEHITKATDHIAEQIALVQKLEEKGYTYQITDGVYFDTSKFPTYADFAHLNLDELKAGARVEYNREKRGPADFALWKFTPASQTRDMEWDSPWGKGFPGWHLECSAMAIRYLGETLDIHTGGIDHIPVHHTNEIAQSEAATGKKFANYWLHNAHLLSEGTKISKSLENGFTLQQIAEHGFEPLHFKLFALQSHYRTETNFTWENLTAAKNRLKNFQALADLRFQPTHEKGLSADDFAKTQQTMLDALQDDLNTPEALAALSELEARAETKLIADALAFKTFVEFLDEALGLSLLSSKDINETQKGLLIERQRAREAKDWARSDELRDKLSRDGLNIRDTAHGQVWSRV